MGKKYSFIKLFIQYTKTIIKKKKKIIIYKMYNYLH